MSNQIDSSSLGFRIHRVLSGNKVRFIVQRETDNSIPLSLSIFEAFLSYKTISHNSVYDNLYCLTFLYSWADKSKINLDQLVLKGNFLKPVEVNQFAFWLKNRGKRNTLNSTISIQIINRILSYSKRFFEHFASQYAVINDIGIERAIKHKNYLDYISQQFKVHKVKEKVKLVADDLSEEDICKIEDYLRPANRIKNKAKLSKAQIIRDYLFWRLAIEFGFREGEILALRLDDLPMKKSNTVKIVRIEERGEDYIDPRGKYAPRPKTLSRELGFILSNSPIPSLINEYTTKYRKRKIMKHGRKVYQWIMDRPAFLILSHHHDVGNPLSVISAQDIAKDIRENTGVKFRWHLARHAFFNRAYAGLLELKDKDPFHHEARVEDLVYWGGWASSKSLQIYVNKARKNRAEKALRVKRTVYPEIALREIIANALIHQDFSVRGSGPLVEIFDDRIEISNPGSLLPSKQLDRLIGTQPESRNELLARTFRRYKICEEQGSGLMKAGIEVELYGLPPIKFESGSNYFKVTLSSPRSFGQMTPRERLDACYQHAVLKHLSGSAMTNKTLRERLKMPEKQSSMVSSLIQEALDYEIIKPADPENKSRKFSKYVPTWA